MAYGLGRLHNDHHCYDEGVVMASAVDLSDSEALETRAEAEKLLCDAEALRVIEIQRISAIPPAHRTKTLEPRGSGRRNWHGRRSWHRPA
jgi:hypothetical protein